MSRPLSIAITLASVAGTSAATADIRAASFSGFTQFVYEVGPVPDIDQRRSGLGENGRNFCVPTSFLNWSAYIAWHGNPGIAPGPDWYSPSVYDTITLNAALMGVNMSTNPASGTSMPDAVNGGQSWFGSNAFVLYFDAPSDTGTILGEMALAGINGSLVMPRVWWLEEVGNNL
ncbi:MAG: hypothetical protein AAFY46_15085, partial [Planctomycetota bacterium]